MTWPGSALTEMGSTLLNNAVNGTAALPFLAQLGGVGCHGLGFVTKKAGLVAAFGVLGISDIREWALGSFDQNIQQLDLTSIGNERGEEMFETNRIHIAICGRTGSGKSSILNALRGIPNGSPSSARTGTIETTTMRGKYPSHESLFPLMIHDIPGGEQDKSLTHSIYIDIQVIKACIRNKQPFIVLRSKSDISINSIKEDDGLDLNAAKTQHVKTSLDALRTEFESAGVPRNYVDDMMKHCVLVSKEALREATGTAFLKGKKFLENKLGEDINIREASASDFVTLERGALKAIHFMQGIARPLCIRYPGGNGWTSPFSIFDVSPMYVKISKSGQRQHLIRVDVTLEDSTALVRLSLEKTWPFAIRNESNVEFKFWQANSTGDNDNIVGQSDWRLIKYRLPGRSIMPYAWDYPIAKSKAVVISAFGKEQHIILDKIGPASPFGFTTSDQRNVIAIEVMARGPAQILTLSQAISSDPDTS